MPYNKTVEDGLKEFDEKVAELKNATIYLELGDESQNVEFGYRVKRGNETFKVVDFGNIKSFLTTFAEKIREGVVEEVEKPPSNNLFCLLVGIVFLFNYLD